jgi:hypothetical protein
MRNKSGRGLHRQIPRHIQPGAARPPAAIICIGTFALILGDIAISGVFLL